MCALLECVRTVFIFVFFIFLYIHPRALFATPLIPSVFLNICLYLSLSLSTHTHTLSLSFSLCLSVFVSAFLSLFLPPPLPSPPSRSSSCKIYQSLNLSEFRIFIFIYIILCLSVIMSFYPPIHLFAIFLHSSLSVYLFIYCHPSIDQSVGLPICLFVTFPSYVIGRNKFNFKDGDSPPPPLFLFFEQL